LQDVREEQFASQTALARIVAFLMACAVGVLAFAATMALGEINKKKIIFLLAAPLILLGARASRHAKAVFLFFWVIALPYNRMYFSVFEKLFGDNGPHGLYWIPSDLVFLILMGLWLHEMLIHKQQNRPHGDRLWPWLLPFVIAGVISSLGAEQINWGFFEVARLLKFGLIVLYMRYNLGKVEWWTCVAALGCSALFQSSLGALQVAMRSVGGLLSMGGGDASAQELGLAAMGGWIRAVGTIGHPSNLACYLLIPLPILAGLALTIRPPAVRAMCALLAIANLAGLGCTLSRWPWALAAGQLLLLAVLLMVMRILPLKQVIGIASVGGFISMLSLMPLTDFIYERLTRDLKASLDFRAKDTRIAMRIFTESPLIGVGLNNYAVQLLKYDPDIGWALEHEDVARNVMHVRTFVALHNFYLFMLAETGAIGLTALVFFFLGVIRIAIRAIMATTSTWRVACTGMLLAILGVLAQCFVDFSLWVDPLLYTFALIVGLLVTAPALCRADEKSHQRTAVLELAR
jgi:O-antigen ligase